MRDVRTWMIGVVCAVASGCGGEDEHLIDGPPADAVHDSQQDANGDASVRVCGGFAGEGCPLDQFCNWPENDCGGTDGQGVCETRPVGCPDLLVPELVCGCDGMVYSSECDASAAGADLSALGNCPTPTDHFACGHRFCRLADQYCLRSVSDVAGFPDEWDCLQLPAGCSPNPSCACLAQQSCGDMCSGNAAQGLTLTCPGG